MRYPSHKYHISLHRYFPPPPHSGLFFPHHMLLATGLVAHSVLDATLLLVLPFLGSLGLYMMLSQSFSSIIRCPGNVSFVVVALFGFSQLIQLYQGIYDETSTRYYLSTSLQVQYAGFLLSSCELSSVFIPPFFRLRLLSFMCKPKHTVLPHS